MKKKMNPNPEQMAARWQDSLPEDWTITMRDESGQEVAMPIREHPALAKYESKDDAVKALVHAQRLIGRRPEGYVEAPTPDASPEQREAFFAALGRPEHPDEYELPDLDLPDDFELDEDLRTMFRQKAHELGLSPDQVRGLYEWFLPLNVDAHMDLQDQAKRQMDGELESLRHVYRGETPQVLETAQKAALALGGEELVRVLDETGAGSRAPVINAFAKLAPTLLEGSLKGQAGSSKGLTKQTLREMMKDPRYHDPLQRDPDYVQQVRQGFERLYPGTYTPGTRV